MKKKKNSSVTTIITFPPINRPSWLLSIKLIKKPHEHQK